MTNKLLQKEKNGYTLTEMLVVVAILIIVSVIAIPAIGSLRKNLELTKYDDFARQIYLVSQNKLTTMKSVGTLSTFLEEVEADYGERRLGMLDRFPQDYDKDTDDWKKLYYFTDSDTILLDYIVGQDSVLMASMEINGHFLVELNPETGDVYGVFYSEKVFTYDDIEELHSRNKSDRKEKMIGYYGGVSELSAIANLPGEFMPTVSVINKEDLYLDIECSEMRKLIKTQNNIVLTITVTDESFLPEDPLNHVFSVDLKGGKDFWISRDKVKVKFLLDSIRGDAEGFKNITQGKLTPGDNITVNVSMTYTNEEATITGSALAPGVNSLFASKDDKGNLSVAYVRHLDNLRASTYSPVGDNEVTINQTKAIDYDYNNWDSDALIPSKSGIIPYSGGFEPIQNTVLLNNIAFDGNHNELLNFNILGTNNVGLFSTLENCTLKNMNLVNFSVLGNAYVGALAGQIQGGSIIDCGVYLETRDAYQRPLTDMAECVARYKITGSDYVGGLVGRISGATITKGSFAAVNVFGNSYIGGFCGQYSGGSVLNSYASGSINAKASYGGGFAGRVANTVINQCYATSDVTVPVYGGGFAGSIANGSVVNCNSYGIVKRSDGTSDTGTSGGFAGSSATSFRNCKFLRQANYNYDYTLNLTGVMAKGFPDLKISGNQSDDCHPYENELVGNSIPFQMLSREDGTILPHYGNWPAELKLQTSLVYYERYATADVDGNYYGYYAETSLMAKGDGLDTGGINSWKVNTLREEPCVEDGYALMTIFSLSKFTYRLNADLYPGTGTVTVDVATTPGVNKAVKITDRVSLQFSNTVDGSKYTISNAKVFQLPFSLQMTDRNTAARFYDRLTITGYVNNLASFENYTFFYCPDFAKNAINPDISSTAAATPKNPTGEERPISVRSPRHMNALARAAYYWNTTKWTDSTDTRYYFRQENDIDFAVYTKNYCGISYDLMDTSSGNAYRNRPIGRPNSQPFTDPNGDTYTPSNFRNSYDGQGYKIVDYRCVTSQADKYQFTGLFGEVQKAVLKNIVMVASDPENNSGYVVSKYNDSSKHPGVGALAGLVYVDSGSEYSDNVYASVTNCSVSGYTVRYSPDGSANQPSAVGGLVGYNFGKIENSSAVNKLVTAENSGNKTRYIGGLVGSINARGSITNCYAGGVVTAVDTGSARTNLAGICAGFDDIYGAYYTSGQSRNRDMPIKNVYSYCTWENGEIRGTPYAVVNKQDKMSIQNGYFLTDTVDREVTLYGTDFSVDLDFSQLTSLTLASSATAKASGRATSSNTHPWSVSLASLAYSFPAVITDPKTGDYVHYGDWYYESTVKDSGYLAYYEMYSDGTFACSFINGNKGLTDVGTFDAINNKTITMAGYGILDLSEDKGTFTVDDTPLVTEGILQRGITVNKGVYDLYTLNQFSESLLLPERNEKNKEIQFRYDETEGAVRFPVKQTIYINSAYANALSTKALEASPSLPLKVRTASQLQNMDTAPSGWYIKLDHDITADADIGNITNAGYVFEGGYVPGGSEKTDNGYKIGSNGNHIFGLTRPLFGTIDEDGMVRNLALVGVNLSSMADKLAPVALANNGTIQNCFVTGEIRTTETNYGNAGFVFENNGLITTSYSNINLSNDKGETAGFVLRNRGDISNCYAVGQAFSGNADASGFIGNSFSGSSVQNSYTLMKVEGKQSYGFAPVSSVGINTSCFWAKDNSINNNILNSAGTSKKLSQMKTVFTNGVWTTENEGATWANTMNSNYPYSRISALDHCGDWPLATGGGKVGVFKLYYKKNGNNSGYYANGVVIDLNDMSELKLQKQGSADTYYNYEYYGIVFDSAFAEDLSSWEAKYTYTSGGWTYEKNIPLTDSSGVELMNSNANGLTTNLFWVDTWYYNLQKITLRNKNDDTEYVFDYHNQSFRYRS
ncbi:GLUG motif-containing protein [Anaerotignum sp.]|uniref:GLUG motif-containing protein n=1 Tax=Anaerotignum sp. TaxID=2039241 RepID=UPI002714AB34|nr:GLUG motif-containing protein [Anaerotignum sp.]